MRTAADSWPSLSSTSASRSCTDTSVLIAAAVEGLLDIKIRKITTATVCESDYKTIITGHSCMYMYRLRCVNTRQLIYVANLLRCAAL
jgi:hypothetical protein